MGRAQSGSGRSAAAVVIISVGVFLLLAQLGIFSFNLMGLLWPFFIIIPGLAFLYPAWKGGPDAAPLAIPGAIITGTGALLLLQSVTGRWESWAYVWTLYPVFLGLGFMLMGRRSGNRRTLETGRGFVRWGLIAFIIFAAFFELFIFTGARIGSYLVPAVLILAGLWLLLRHDRGARRDKDEEDVFTFGPSPASKPKRTTRTSASDDLRHRIDLALAEEGEPEPVPPEPPTPPEG